MALDGGWTLERFSSDLACAFCRVARSGHGEERPADQLLERMIELSLYAEEKLKSV